LLELRQIRDDAVDAVFAGRVRIGNGADAEVLRALAFAGPLAHADEEALVGGEAVFIFKTHAGGLPFPGEIREQRATEVGGVFTAGEL